MTGQNCSFQDSKEAEHGNSDKDVGVRDERDIKVVPACQRHTEKCAPPIPWVDLKANQSNTQFLTVTLTL